MKQKLFLIAILLFGAIHSGANAGIREVFQRKQESGVNEFFPQLVIISQINVDNTTLPGKSLVTLGWNDSTKTYQAIRKNRKLEVLLDIEEKSLGACSRSETRQLFVEINVDGDVQPIGLPSVYGMEMITEDNCHLGSTYNRIEYDNSRDE